MKLLTSGAVMPTKRPVYRAHPVTEPVNPGGGDPFYCGRRWRKVRKMVLAKQPLCVLCLEDDRTNTADLVDHVIPIKDGGAAYDLANLQALCHTHHNRKHG